LTGGKDAYSCNHTKQTVEVVAIQIYAPITRQRDRNLSFRENARADAFEARGPLPDQPSKHSIDKQVR